MAPETILRLAQERFFEPCKPLQDWVNVLLKNLPIASPRVPHTPRRLRGIGPLYLPGVGNLTTRWVTLVGRIDRRQSVLWSSRVPVTDSMDQVSQTYRTLPAARVGLFDRFLCPRVGI